MRAVLFSLIGFGGLLILLLAGWVTARLTGALQYYTTPSPANVPTLRVGDNFFTSNLVQPKRLDFIAYQHRDQAGQSSVWMHRLCGLPGDTLEMRRGLLYVNGQNLDAALHLQHYYTLAKADFAHLPAAAAADTLGADRTSSPDSITRIGLNDSEVARYHLPARRMVLPATYFDSYIQQQHQRRWNQDNFGPLVVPANFYFVLGDSRHNAMDSRYIGVIPKEDFRGTILGKH